MRLTRSSSAKLQPARTCRDDQHSVHPPPTTFPALRDGPSETVQDKVFANEIAIAVHA